MPTLLRIRRSYWVQLLSSAGLNLTGVFIPLIALGLGASNFEIGVIGAAGGLSVGIAATLFGRAADQYGRRRFIRLGLGLAAVAALVHLLADTWWQLAAARFAFGLAAGMFPAALTAYAFDEHRQLGRFAGWSALGIAVGGAVAVGLGLTNLVFWAAAAFFAVAFGVASFLTRPSDRKVRVPIFPREVIRRNRFVFLGMVLRHTGASSVWIVFPIYWVAELGGTPSTVALFYMLNALLQFPLMSVADRFAAQRLVSFGLLMSALTFFIFLAATEWWQIMPVAAVLAMSWSALWVGSLMEIMEHNVERATATGLLHTAQYLSNVVGPFLGGVVAHFYGFHGTILFAALLSLAALALYRWHDVREHPPVLPQG